MERRAFFHSSAAVAMAASVPASWRWPRYRRVRQEHDVAAVTGEGKQITLRGSEITELERQMRGHVLLAETDGYDEARRVLNPSFDKHPALIAQVTGTADIRLAVDFAREHSLLLAVKCGGHSASGKSTCDRGMMIDLSRFRDVRVDPEARRAWVTGGSLLGRLDHESMSYDLVTTMGTVSHTGVGGLVTAGGFGRVARHFGLAIDNLTALDVVTADGQFRRANPEHNADLFWGVRGGGGNFGVVTSFEFQLHPMPRQVIGGVILYPIERARDALRLYGQYLPEAPDALDIIFLLLRPAGSQQPPATGFAVCYSGAPAGADRALAPLRGLGTPLVDAGPVDYVALQRSGDIDDPRARASYLKSGFVAEMPEDLIAAVIDGFAGAPNRATEIFIQPGLGAIGRVANNATAFSQRDALGNLGVGVDWPFGTDPAEHIAWIKEYWTHIEPFTQGFYTNDGAPDQYARPTVAGAYRQNYPRLVEIKNKYDPGNLFRLNANIEPTV